MNRRIIDDITDFIFVADEPQKSDIILMPGSSDPAVPELAARLYAEGFAPLVMPSGGVSLKTGKFAGVKAKREIYSGDYKTDCEFYTDVLIKNGVPQTAILCEDKSGFTKENALFSRKIADENHLVIKSAIICCKSFHARRSLMMYQVAFPDARILVCPIDVLGISRESWHTLDIGIDRVLGELSRCGNQLVDEIKEMTKK
jgi:uncharacterized SAM-binding protein YcdF (DUF218 family)